MKRRNYDNAIAHLLIVALAAGVFIIDLATNAGTAAWLLYFAPLLLAFYVTRPIAPLVVALAASFFLAAGYYFTPAAAASELFIAGLDRTLGAISLCAVAIVGRQLMEAKLKATELDWLKSGQHTLAARMQGEQTVEGLGRKILGFLTEYFDAQVGAVYVGDETGSFVRTATYAWSGTLEADSGVIKPNEGLVGEAAANNRLIILHDVPEGYAMIRSGTGAAKPSSIIVAPMRALGEVSGVIELGFFQPPPLAVSEMLNLIADAIGVAFHSSKYKARQIDLLEESHRLSEQLQAQEEELRVQNEELEEQGRTLHGSQDRLERQQTQLEHTNKDLERERDELIRTQREVQRANEYKSEFLANMSHELRTPLNSSLILAKLLADNRDGNLHPEQVKFAQTIYSAGNDLLTLISDILDLSRIEAGKLDVRADDIPIARLLGELTDTFSPVARDKHLELTAQVEADSPTMIHSDPTRLQQILKNLLANALKFTEQGGVSLLVGRAPSGRMFFAVKDTGNGIVAEQHQVIFEAFRQADGTTNRKYGGTGLGLSISRDLARLLGGELIVESAPGCGSTFTLLLPERYALGEPVSLLAPVAESATHPSPIPMASAPTSARVATHASAAVDDRERLTGSRTILIVEDDPRFAQVLCDLARERDFAVLMASSGDEGLAMAERYRPSAIVLDVGLPDRSGLSVLDVLKHNPITRHIPVHMASLSDYSQVAMEMGAVGYALKPVQREDLVDAFKRLESKLTKKRRIVLVVEDDAVHRDSTCKLLASEQVQTVAVGTKAEALAQLSTATFDCLVLDLALPDGSGLALLEEMALKDQYSFPPVIVYTGRTLSRDEDQQLRRFSQSIIIKGARSPERLLDEVALFLHQVESELPVDRQRMLRDVRHREAVFEGRRILVAEDDARNIFALSSVLEPKGVKVEIARNGREVLAHLKQHPGVDLVLMDIMMPEMDGLQTTREIRKMPQYAKLPIIALTAKAMAEDRETCLAAGANDYIAKPIDVDKMLSLIRVWMPK